MRRDTILDKIKIHSVIDIITNSSTESYTFQNEMSAETIKTIIAAVVLTYNAANGTEFTPADLEYDVYVEDGYIKVTGDLTGPKNEDIPEGLLESIKGIFQGNWDENYT